MGNFFNYLSVSHEPNDEIDLQNMENNIIEAISKGPFFGPYFYLGGRQFANFESDGPPLFGDNLDYNFYVQNASKFRKPLLTSETAIRPLTVNINLLKETLRLTSETSTCSLSFCLDCLQPCSVQLYFFATEQFSNGILHYNSKGTLIPCNIPHINFPIGFGHFYQQNFPLPLELADRLLWKYQDSFKSEQIYPIVIVLQTLLPSSTSNDGGGEEEATAESIEISSPSSSSSAAAVQQQVTLCSIDFNSTDDRFNIHLLKQKVCIDGVCIYIQDIYGLENNNNKIHSSNGESCQQNGTIESTNDFNRCVVCLNVRRDTIILSCRHLCLCQSCAIALRFSANVCPICRSPFRAMLRLRGLKKILNKKSKANVIHSTAAATTDGPIIIDKTTATSSAPDAVVSACDEDAVVIVECTTSSSNSGWAGRGSRGRDPHGVNHLVNEMEPLNKNNKEKRQFSSQNDLRLLNRNKFHFIPWKSIQCLRDEEINNSHGNLPHSPPIPDGYEEVNIVEEFLFSNNNVNRNNEDEDEEEEGEEEIISQIKNEFQPHLV